MNLVSMVSMKYLKFLAALFGLAIGLTMSVSTALAGHSDTTPNLLPHGEYTIWSPNADAPNFGSDPNMSAADLAGVTNQVSTALDPLTIIIVYENTICTGGPCGVTYLNPETNFAKCYGYSAGLMTGVDVNSAAPRHNRPARHYLWTGGRLACQVRKL